MIHPNAHFLIYPRRLFQLPLCRLTTQQLLVNYFRYTLPCISPIGNYHCSCLSTQYPHDTSAQSPPPLNSTQLKISRHSQKYVHFQNTGMATSRNRKPETGKKINVYIDLEQRSTARGHCNWSKSHIWKHQYTNTAHARLGFLAKKEKLRKVCWKAPSHGKICRVLNMLWRTL